ncbi:LuxR C-terminal-related transcriptional regulator [Streptomyces sp. NPDC094153]|uniref:LuxR C-terminal-related transcriptional regulator n=1 Tax=Streptomyces sp. NPDC094153 TaxID=3366058 RepID=UPI00382BF875
MTAEPISPRLLAQLRASVERNPTAGGARAVRMLLAEVDRLTTSLSATVPEPKDACPLTKTQMAIIAATANGKHCEAIGRDLCLSGATVSRYRQEAMRRLGADTPAQAVAVCLINEWLPKPAVTRPQPFNLAPVSGLIAYRDRAEELRQHPGRWGTVATYATAKSAVQSAYRLRSGAFTAFRPKGAWQAKSYREDGVHGVRARYIGTTVERAGS